MDALLIERADGVVTCTLNRPEKKNAVTSEMWLGLIDLFEAVATNPDDRVLVITGAGDGFCSGADLGDTGTAEAASGVGGALAGMRIVGNAALGLHDLGKPTIAAVNGVAAGAGCNLALGCDLVIASDRARFSEIFSKRGLARAAAGEVGTRAKTVPRAGDHQHSIFGIHGHGFEEIDEPEPHLTRDRVLLLGTVERARHDPAGALHEQ